MNKIMEHKQSGMGGIFFCMTTLLCSLALLFIITISWGSTAQSTANNLAYMVSMASTTYNYNSNTASYTKSGGTEVAIKKNNYNTDKYYPLNEYNTYLSKMGITKSGVKCSTVKIVWSKANESTTVTFGPVSTYWGVTIQPDPQKTQID
jgi:hypothetical protein